MITAIGLFLVFIGVCLIGHAWISIGIGIWNRRKFDSLVASVDHARSWPKRLFRFKK